MCFFNMYVHCPLLFVSVALFPSWATWLLTWATWLLTWATWLLTQHVNRLKSNWTELLFPQIRSHCSYPCECPSRQPACPVGVSVVRDGCGCCAICARQQGEQCDGTTLCDEKRGLVCQYPHRAAVKGVCQGIVFWLQQGSDLHGYSGYISVT